MPSWIQDINGCVNGFPKSFLLASGPTLPGSCVLFRNPHSFFRSATTRNPISTPEGSKPRQNSIYAGRRLHFIDDITVIPPMNRISCRLIGSGSAPVAAFTLCSFPSLPPASPSPHARSLLSHTRSLLCSFFFFLFVHTFLS